MNTEIISRQDKANEEKRLGAAHIILPIGALFCLTPLVGSAMALIFGIALAVVFGNPYLNITKQLTHKLLTLSVVGLGAGMNLNTVGRAGIHGFGYTLLSISLALVFGFLIGKLLKVNRDTSLLITVGTAICGGSAIAAIAPTIRAKHHEVSVALGTVFLLNAIALVVFPWIGHRMDLTQTQFGLWSALAIHDTSSVVGATLQYGAKAVEIGTTVKLTRALWIIPLAFLIGTYRTQTSETGTAKQGKVEEGKKPWFILGFLLMAALVTWMPALQTTGQFIESLAKRSLILTLFLIGTNLTYSTIRSVGIKPFVQGVLLWLVVATTSLGAIHLNWIR